MAWTRTLIGGASSVGAGSPATFTTLSLTADTSQVVLDSDGTNLAYTVTVATGSKVLITAAWLWSINVSAASTVSFALTDGTTLLAETVGQVGSTTSAAAFPTSLAYVFTGDGASHTFKLRWLNNSANTLTLYNTTATFTPMMTFWMGVAS